eukprot:403346512
MIIHKNIKYLKLLTIALLLLAQFSSIVQSSTTCFYYSMPISIQFNAYTILTVLDYKNNYIYAAGYTNDQQTTESTLPLTPFYLKVSKSGEPKYMFAIKNLYGQPINIKFSLTSVFVLIYNLNAQLYYMAVFNESDGSLTNVFGIPWLSIRISQGLGYMTMDANQYDEVFITFTPYYIATQYYWFYRRYIPYQIYYYKYAVMKIYKETNGYYYAKVLFQTQNQPHGYTRGVFTRVVGDYVYAVGELDILGTQYNREPSVIKMDRFGNNLPQGGVISGQDIHYFITYNYLATAYYSHYVRVQGSTNVLTFFQTQSGFTIYQSQPDSTDSYALRLMIAKDSVYWLQTFSFTTGIAVNKKLTYYTNKQVVNAVFTGGTPTDKLYILGYSTNEFLFTTTDQWTGFPYMSGFIQVQNANGDKDTTNDCASDFTSNNTITTLQFSKLTNVIALNILPYVNQNFYVDQNAYPGGESIASFPSQDVFDYLRFITTQLACHPPSAMTYPKLSYFQLLYFDSTNQTKNFTFADIDIDSSVCNDVLSDFGIVDDLNNYPSQNLLDVQDSPIGNNRFVTVEASNLNLGQYFYIYKVKIMPLNKYLTIPFSVYLTQSKTNPCLYPANITDVMNTDLLVVNYTLGDRLNFALINWYYLGGTNVTCQYYTALSVIPAAVSSYTQYNSITYDLSFFATEYSLTLNSPYILTLHIFDENQLTLYDITFSLSIKGCDVTQMSAQTFDDQTYIIGQDTLSVAITPWLANCDLVEYSVYARRYDYQSFSGFIEISGDQKAAKIKSSQSSDKGTYIVTVFGTLKNFTPFSSSFDLVVKLQCTVKPSVIQTPQRYKVGTSKSIMYIPFQSEFCNEPISYASYLDGGNALPSFITFREGRYIIETNNTSIESSYDIKLIGSIPSESIVKDVKFTIKIQFPDLPKVNITTNQSNSNATKTPIISKDFYTLKAKITSISQTGVVSVSFNPEFKLLSNDPDKNTQYFSFDLSMPDTDEKMDKKDYSFDILDISKSKMSVQLQFNDPSIISMKQKQTQTLLEYQDK